jgi:hypothetical protein
VKRQHGSQAYPACLVESFEIIGATARNRTADILITSEVLYRLSYGG